MEFVTIKRKSQDRIPSEIYSSAIQYVGGGYSYDTNDVLRGISFEEESLLLPTIIGVSANSSEFVKKAREFHANIDIPVPPEGKTLNISTRKINVNMLGVEKEYEYPNVPLDYIYYKHCLRHSQVAPNIEEANCSNEVRFYIENKEEIVEKSKVSLDLKMSVRQVLIKIAGGEAKDMDIIRAILILAKDVTGKIPTDNEGETLELLDYFAEKFPTKFLELSSDKTLKERAFVSQLMAYGILTSAGNHIYDETVGQDAIAESVGEFIKYIAQPKNSGYKGQLIAKLQSKRGK